MSEAARKTVPVDESTESLFNIVRGGIEKNTPGVRPSDADVLRYALYLGAEAITERDGLAGSVAIGA